MAQAGRRERPPPEVLDERPLGGKVEPPYDMHDTGQQGVGTRRADVSAIGERGASWRSVAVAAGGSTVGTPPRRLRPTRRWGDAAVLLITCNNARRPRSVR
jgi:hypothetical protein